MNTTDLSNDLQPIRAVSVLDKDCPLCWLPVAHRVHICVFVYCGEIFALGCVYFCENSDLNCQIILCLVFPDDCR